ncbi:MAG: 1,4-alpha-glucan branching protein GlgB [Tissierellia bacterium]|nr:1,4-alpha-glucan branching protein GlgB [Tissierellia bacterium]
MILYEGGDSFKEYLFFEGKEIDAYRRMGAIVKEQGVRFTLWAPNAREVYLVGDFNEWNPWSHPMKCEQDKEFWTISLSEAKVGDRYKYRVITRRGEELYKSDPYARFSEKAPNTASIIVDLPPTKERITSFDYYQPMTIYEVNLSSWRRHEDNRYYTYRELANSLLPYVKEMGFTHIELMPLGEHPYDGSWGYQQTGYFSPTSRFGSPEDLRYFIHKAHNMGIGLILDWVPYHFVKDAHGLANFDGDPLYEYSGEKGENPHWQTKNFNLGWGPIRSFLYSNALYWLKEFQFDGLRIDAVAYLLSGEGIFTGSNIREADPVGLAFIKELTQLIRKEVPGAILIAEDSSSFPNVTKPVEEGGLGFHFKWNMGWMHDTLGYITLDPIYRKDNHKNLTFPLMYGFNEHYILPFSHDEVVHGKKSLINKLPGNYEDKGYGLKQLLLYQYTQPGKKLLFMGGEFGQWIEWNEWQGLDWLLLEYPYHQEILEFVKTLNHLYQKYPALYKDCGYENFHWVEHENHQESIIIYERIHNEEVLVVAFNFTPVERKNYPIGVRKNGVYRELLRTHGPGMGNYKTKNDFSIHGRDQYITIDLPGYGGILLEEPK